MAKSSSEIAIEIVYNHETGETVEREIPTEELATMQNDGDTVH